MNSLLPSLLALTRFDVASGVIDGFLALLVYGLTSLFVFFVIRTIGNFVKASSASKVAPSETPKPVIVKEESLRDTWPIPMKSSGYVGLAGWYRDPSGQYKKRYFDGKQWTNQVRPERQTVSSLHEKSRRFESQSALKTQHIEPVVERMFPSGPIANDFTARLVQLADLYSKGLLTEDEYSAAKERLLET
jgi:hypothetical protein